MGKWEELLGTQSISLASIPGTTANPACDLVEQPQLRFPGLWKCHITWAGGVQSLAVPMLVTHCVSTGNRAVVGCRCSVQPSDPGWHPDPHLHPCIWLPAPGKGDWGVKGYSQFSEAAPVSPKKMTPCCWCLPGPS